MLREITWLKSKKIYHKIWITGILLIPVILYLVPVDWLEKQHSICLFKNLTGTECYGCGMTRAILSALHFEFNNAFYYNKLVVIVLPLLIYIWTNTLIKQWTKKPTYRAMHDMWAELSKCKTS